VILVRAAGVGNWDEIVRVGDWGVGRRPPPALGVEASGIVDAVGEDVTGLAQGDEVLTHPLPLRYQGAWAEWLVAPAALVARKPIVVPWETAAAFPVPALTADQALQEGRRVQHSSRLLSSKTTTHPALIPQEVAGSSRPYPAIPATPVSKDPAHGGNPRLSPLNPQAPRPACHAGGRGFESLVPAGSSRQVRVE
jgi:hypothetical protein